MNYLSMKGKISFVLISAFLMTNASFATTNYSYESEFQTKIDKPLKSNIISVPAGSVVSALAMSELSSEFLTHGQVVQMALGSNFYFNNQLIAPAGSIVNGTVTAVSKATDSTDGKLKIMFTQIITPQGLQIPISALFKTNDGTGILEGDLQTDIIIPANTSMDLILSQPITVQPQSFSYED